MAEEILTKTIPFYKQQKNGLKLGNAYSYRGDLYSKKKAYALAIADCELNKELFKKSNALEIYSVACNCLYVAFKAEGENSKALLNYKSYVTAKDSIFN